MSLNVPNFETPRIMDRVTDVNQVHGSIIVKKLVIMSDDRVGFF